MIMTPMSSRTLVLSGAACFVVTACLSSAVVLGSRASAWVAAACLAITLGVVLSAIRAATATVVRAPYGRQLLVRKKYPSFDSLLGQLGWAVRDRRHFDRVFAPLLREIALDLPQAASAAMTMTRLRAAVGEDLWPLLDPERLPADGSAGEPPPPSIEELTVLTTLLEHLERPWR